MKDGFAGHAAPTIAVPPIPGPLPAAAGAAATAPGNTALGNTALGNSVPELLSPAEAAQALGVSEADVMTVLESGELKGKKIGATWRITRAALTSYMSA
jgi:excisionase family DNA binding protein